VGECEGWAKPRRRPLGPALPIENTIRRELGLPERPCKLADPRFSLVATA